ncbi:MAG: hypothetical protein PUA90_04255 [bacterium]|nr:hypothetical protein [bacterium]
MSVKKFFLPILEDKNNKIDTTTIDKEIRALEKGEFISKFIDIFQL